ncbi:dUTP diphosphatase [Ancylobacter sp. TS-1]|uniref:dUTP diphosphatase n=1 Tax=Ancylobacter sp. TS-1 TaxID=1850374 RepID=UPI001265B4FE|nr:dUTP diphosphatase [Ancylobacter sp. TS-1]QFR34554.1 dUTP diphosphatase [Ancylobacter sp. TS-1]
MSLEVSVVVLPHGEGLPLPAYATLGSAGLDLIAALPEGEPLILAPLARAAVPTGLCIALPEGYEAQVRPRSGLALKQGLTVLNAPGTVDSDYRGEVKVLLVNLSDAPVVLERGQRIAQMVVAPVTRIHLTEAGSLTETTRGDGGFGSTGLDGRQISR